MQNVILMKMITMMQVMINKKNSYLIIIVYCLFQALHSFSFSSSLN